MASPLEKSIREAIASGFKNQLRTGQLTRLIPVPNQNNEFGDPVEQEQSFSVEGFPSNYDEKYRVATGIPETNFKIVLILGNSETEPKKDDLISFPDSGFKDGKVRNVKIDPARASAVCEVFGV